MNKNEQLILTAIDYTDQGVAVCKHEGFVVFVPKLMKGENALVQIVKVQAKHAFGKVVELIDVHPDRVSPPCPIAHRCGGCQLQHMAYDHQLAFKTAHVQSLFERGLKQTVSFEPIIGMDHPWAYRNKALVPFDEATLDYGFYRPHSHDLVPFEACLIQSDEANQILKAIQDFYRQSQTQPTGLRTVLIKKGFSTNQLMVVLVVRSLELPLKDQLSAHLKKGFPNLVSLELNLNTRDDNVVLGERYVSMSAQTHIEDSLDGLRFEISAPSFYQVNPIQTVKLYQKAIDFAQLTGQETVLDLYCGIGTIGLFASRQAKQVIGVEVVPSAIENAKRNATLNAITNIEWILGDAGEAAAQLHAQNHKPDVILVDPPRKGLDAKTIQALLDMQAQRIVYVSCDPGTLVRDLAALQDKYTIEKAICVDMFPQTYHVECVIMMTYCGQKKK